MKTMIFAVVAALAMSAGTAFAQGTAGASAPIYGSAWAAQSRADKLSATNPPQNTRAGAAEKTAREVPPSVSAKGG